MRTLVTGATGLVGGRLVALLRERGWAVRALRRPGRDSSALAAIGAETVTVSLDERAALERACAGRDVVFHVAAALGSEAVPPLVYRTNVEGTTTLLHAAHAAGVRRFVFTSSVAVYGEDAPDGADEDTPPSPSGPYGESKVRAEAVCRAVSQRSGIEVVILRPCFIYGPADRNFTPSVAAIIRGGWFPLVDGGRAPVDVAHVDDVAAAHVLAATIPQAAGRTYNVTDGTRRSVRRLVELASRAMGVRVRSVRIPPRAIRPAAALLRTAANVMRASGREMVTAENLRAMNAPHHFSIGRARAELGFEPVKQAEEWLEPVLRPYASSQARR